jgi:L-fucose mutarotase/ribose pyranase (RbsD/FucU family)
MCDATSKAISGWERRLRELLPVYGHRNWIVVADAAYPAQSKPGIETIVAGVDQIDAVRAILQAIAARNHIRANVFTDSELCFVDDRDAPGISAYREQLDALLAHASRKQQLHEEIIARLDQSAQIFRILIVKTTLTIPYTSVFFELDCGYWNGDAEDRLRRAIEASEGKDK